MVHFHLTDEGTIEFDRFGEEFVIRQAPRGCFDCFPELWLEGFTAKMGHGYGNSPKPEQN